MSASRSLSPHADQVRRLDNDRFLTALFAPDPRRAALLALYAFNLEVARIPEAVSEPLLGFIRLQWWREGVEEVYAGAPPRHGLLSDLAEAVRRYRLSRSHFDVLLEARERDLDERPPEDMDALLAYAEGTSASLTALALEILCRPPQEGVKEEGAKEVPPQGSPQEGGPRQGEPVQGGPEEGRAEQGPGPDRLGEDGAAAGRHIGIAWALVGLLRAVGFHARARRLYLPQSLLGEAGVDPEEVFARRPSSALARVAAAVAEPARAHLAAARRLRPQVPRCAHAALLPAVLADAYLARLARAGFDVFDPGLAIAEPMRVLRLAVAALRGRY